MEAYPGFMTESPRPFYIASTPQTSSAYCPVHAPEDGRHLGFISLANASHLTQAIHAAEESRAELSKETSELRSKRIQCLAEKLASKKEAFVAYIRDEAGKPQRYAIAEVDRAIQTLYLAAKAAQETHTREESFDGRKSLIQNFPIGVCAFVTPFNFPLNLAMHKVAPALATGCPFVLKPAEKTPLSALLLGEILSELEPPLPKGSWSILPALPEECGPLTDSPLVRHFSFTGSASVGWKLKARAPHARTTLELGGNATAVLCEDWDLNHALDRCTIGAFAYSGQVCISLQRLLVPKGMLDKVIAGLTQRIKKLRCGPLSEMETDFGPMINEESAKRVEEWIREAQKDGGRLHCGGNRTDNLIEPTLLSNVPHHVKAWTEEIFGPVLVVEEWSDFSSALVTANESKWGLQAAVFSHDEQRIQQAFQELEVGQVIIGDSTSFRVDEMPYGGVKASGCGREGIPWAMEAMQETKLLVGAPKI